MHRLVSWDPSLLLRDIGTCIELLDRIGSYDSELDLGQMRKRLVEVYLDVLTKSSSVFDQAID